MRLDAPRGGLSAFAVEHVEHLVPDCLAVHHVSLFLHALGTGTAAPPRMPCRSSRIRNCPSPRYRRGLSPERRKAPGSPPSRDLGPPRSFLVTTSPRPSRRAPPSGAPPRERSPA